MATTSTATVTDTSATTAIELTNRQVPRPSQRDLFNNRPLTSREEEDAILQESRNGDLEVPDGGYGWAVVAGCALLAWVFIGPTYTWGIFQSVFVQRKLASASALAYVGSIATTCISIFTILFARVIRMIGVRRTAFTGVCIMALSHLLASFAVNNFIGLLLTAGLTMGIGVSLCFITVTSVPSQYFNRKRGLANGIVFAGGGLGGATMSFMNEALIHKLGPAWTYRILSVFTLAIGLPAAWLVKERVPLRPLAFVDK